MVMHNAGSSQQTVEQILAQAIDCHQSGRFQAAEEQYRGVLKTRPGHPGANYLLGVLALQLGRPDVGLNHFKAALEADQQQEQYWLAYLDVLIQFGQPEAARQVLQLGKQRGLSGAAVDAFAGCLSERADTPTPDEVPIRGKSGKPPRQDEIGKLLTQFSEGRYLEVASGAQAMTRNFPQHEFGWKVLGLAQRKMGLNTSALVALKQAVRLAPGDVEAQNNLGNALRALGRAAEAEGCFLRAIKIRPEYAESHSNLGNALRDLGRLSDAEARYRRALRLKPALAEAHNNLGNTLRDLGRPGEAEACFLQSVRLRPDDALAVNNLGNVQRDLGRLSEAEASYRRALQLQPRMAEAHNNLGITLFDQGRADEAEACFLRALELRADYVEARFNLSNVLRALARPAESEACLLQVLERRPDYAGAHYNLGNALLDQGRSAEAVASLRRALASLPDDVDTLNNLGVALRDLDLLAESEACFMRALQLRPEFAEAQSNLGITLWDLGRLDEAEACHRRALIIRPDYVDAHSNLGSVLMDLGHMAEAERSLSQAIRLAPGAARPLANALLLLPYHAEDARFAQLETLYAQRASLPFDDRVKLNFAMGRAMEQTGQYDRAFAAYEEGNRLHFQRHPFDETADECFVEASCAFFTPDLFQRYAALADDLPPAPDERVPVFIVGMPRSGTSLIEQVLASHPALFGAGELTVLSRLVSRAGQVLRESSCGASALQTLRDLGNDYLDQVWRLAPQASHITDKLPGNAYHLGLIHLMLPNAKIIHSLRDPMDACFSCYAQLFRNGHEYSYDLTALGRQYRRYRKLMRHWQAVLPAGRILDVRYEDNVAHLEQQARRLLSYLDLPWNPACLSFHETRRTVTTASVTQVRQPVYSSSVARWRRFEQYLGPLCENITHT